MFLFLISFWRYTLLEIESEQQEFKIVIYGFDKLGFELPCSVLKLQNKLNIEYIKFEDFRDFDNVDGLIIPQGIFEEFHKKQDLLDLYTKVEVRENLLLEVERQVHNLLEMNKWVCFLVGGIMDEVPAGNYRTNKVDSTDLCKRLLNKFEIDRKLVPGEADVKAKSDEFIKYIEKYGVAKTIFLPRCNGEHTTKGLAFLKDAMVGIEIERNLFFLPFHTTKSCTEDLNSLITVLVNSIIDYRQKHIIEIPNWINDFQFRNEKLILGKIDNLELQLKDHFEQLDPWQQFKTILLASDDVLKDKIIEILAQYFHLKLDTTLNAVFKEDLKIITDDGLVIALIEVEGTKKGVMREHINKVDSQRERNNLSNDVPGILIINSEMECESFDEKLKITVANDLIKHAKNMNVLVIRTIDLLILMRQLEENDQRGDIMLDIIKSGGGFLKVYYEK